MPPGSRCRQFPRVSASSQLTREMSLEKQSLCGSEVVRDQQLTLSSVAEAAAELSGTVVGLAQRLLEWARTGTGE